MLDEYTALIDNKTWELVPRPQNANIIRSMWIFRHKKNSDGSFERHKARLVGDGRSQQKGVDCDETFSPVAPYSALQYLDLGPFTNLMSRMHFFTVTLQKPSTCINL